MEETKIRLEFPKKLQPLFSPKRYKILYGGRGGAKSWGIARALLVLGTKRKMRILCTREYQSSIADSVHKLLSDQVVTMGLQNFYEIQKTTIIGRNGTSFTYAGLKQNIGNIKSFEGADVCWIEEAVDVSYTSWKVLIPTIRKNGSEIWISFNPELEEDETYKRFVKDPPSDSILIKINYTDNKFFPETLRREMEDLKAKNYNEYLNVWEGHCKQTLDGAIYAKEMMAATHENRITKVPYTTHVGVNVFFDLGWADHTSLWFVQKVGFEYRVIECYENRQESFNHYLQHIQSRGYIIDCLFLPHDAQAKSLGSGMSIEEIARKSGFKVRIVPKLSVEDGVNALRTIFPNMWFDEIKCADGIQALRHYRYDVDENGKFSNKPLHDTYSDFADCLRYCAVAMTDKGSPKVQQIKLKLGQTGIRRGGNWMRK